MEFLLEFILELFLEGSMEISSNKKISKWIRYPLMAFILFFFLTVIGLIFFTGILTFSDNKLLSILLLLCGMIMLIGTIIKFRNLYLKRK